MSRRHELPLKPILEVELFDMCEIDFIGLFVSSFSINYIFVVVDYVCKSVEAVPLPDEGKRIVQFLKHNIFE